MTIKPAFVALGDIHLDHFIWRGHRSITGDAFHAFRGFIDHALRLRVPVVILGDLFDSIEPESTLVNFFRQEMVRCQEAGIPVYAIQGNHDKRPTMPWYCAASPWPIHIGAGDSVVTIGGVTCQGYDYALKEQIEEKMIQLTAQPVKPQILMLHQAARQALKFDGAWNFDLDWVPDGIPLVLIADIHKPWDFAIRNGGHAWYTGPSHARDIDQVGPKRCLLVNDDLSVEALPIPYRAIEKFVLTKMSDVQVMTDKFAQFCRASEAPGITVETVTGNGPTPVFLFPVANIRYTADMKPVVEDWKRLAKEQLVYCIEDPMVARTEEDLAKDTDTSDLPSVGELVTRIVDQYRYPAVHRMVLDLMEPNQSAQDTIRVHRDKFLKERHGSAPASPVPRPAA